MRFSTIAVVAFSGFAAAQSTIPACAKTCLDDATSSETTCSTTDIACQCTAANKLAIQSKATPCVLAACGDQALAVLSAANADCAAASEGAGTASTPPISPETSTTVIDTATVTGTISISIIPATISTISESTSTIEAPTGTPSPRPSNGTVVTNSTTTVSTSSVVVVGTGSTTSTPTRSGSGTNTAASTTPPPTGAAVKMVAGSVGGVFAFGLALLAGL